ncbi:MAG: HDIG domain-containing protein [Thermaerobacter sp.]|nr:HDIG domain-containing protein [Thermaerobacter sp.]
MEFSFSELKRFFPSVLRDARQRRNLWVGLFFLALTGIFASSFFSPPMSLKVGQIAPRDVTAPRQIIDPVATQVARKAAAQKVAPVYVPDTTALPAAQEQLASDFQAIAAIQAAKLPTGGQLSKFQQAVPLNLSPAVALGVLGASPTTLANLEQLSRTVLDRVMQLGIKPGNTLTLAKNDVATEVAGLSLGNAAYTSFLDALDGSLVRPNLQYDAAATQKKQAAAMAAVGPTYILKGQLIVQKGTKVTQDELTRLRALGLVRSRGNYAALLGGILFALLVMATLGIYLWKFRRDLFQSESAVVLIGLICIVAFLVSRLVELASPYLMPLATATMLLTLVADARLAILAGVVLVLGVGVVQQDHLRTVVVLATGAMTGIYGVSRLSQRQGIMLAGLYVAGANVVAVAAMFLLGGGIATRSEIAADMGWSLLSGVLAAILTIGSLPFIESLFGIVTPLKLLELSNPNQPLLRQLSLEAPGTYHHSILVANLAEAAAEAVGGDGLLTRVGAYYHDIGKLKRPYFFVDNQLGRSNPHDRLSPSLSTLIITSHVKDGVELAQRHHLPESLIDFIREHHGNTLVSYFYQQAASRGDKEPPSERDYRYPGPKPHSKETAIVMLADAAEASVRAMDNPSPGKVEGSIRKLIQERLYDGQLDESELCLRDLDTIARVFTKVLLGAMHTRIEYPEKMLEEIKGALPKGEGTGVPAAGKEKALP